MLNLKNKKGILVLVAALIITGVSFLGIDPVNAQTSDRMIFKPGIELPGMDNFLSKDIEAEGYIVDGNTIGNYIVALYTYSARFVSVLAMLMLVIAGWQWLFAAGSADKINNAKQTINGVLIGMILLFGGQLLLSQISTGLVSFNTLDIKSDIFTNIDSCSGVRQANPSQVCGQEILLPAQSEQAAQMCLMWNCPANEGQCWLLGHSFVNDNQPFVTHCPSTREELDQMRMSANYENACDCYTAEELVLMGVASY